MATKQLREALANALGGDDPRWEAMAATDPEIVSEFIKLEASTRQRKALEPKVRELVHIAVASSTAHLFEPGIRHHIAKALELGATKEEILDVLRLTSVLGVHTMIPAMDFVIPELGGAENIREKSTKAERERFEKIKADFMKARGGMWGDVWDKVCLMAPDYTAAYADYSGLPHKTGNLSAKLRELLYVAIDISPTHFNAGGARSHLQAAIKLGATQDEVMEVVEIASLIGFHTCIVALPILAEELEKAGKS